MRIVRRVLVGLLVVVLVALVGGYWYARPLLLTGTGYAAHNACAVTHIAGRTNPETDLPPNPLVPYLRTTTEGRESRTTVLGALAAQSAFFDEVHGCVVGGPAGGEGGSTPLAAPEAASVVAPKGAVADAVARAFGDDLSPDAARALGTRAVVVLHDGKVVAERYADGFTPQTRQLGWSMAKSVANLLTGRLVAAGKLKPTDDHLRPEWTDDRAKITVDQLERMTSGLTWDETYDLGTPITRMLYTEPDMAGYAAGLGLAHPVGSYQQYSSGSTNILCAVLAERSGVGGSFAQATLRGDFRVGSGFFETDGRGIPVCSSYLWATPRDWGRLGQVALDELSAPKLLPAGWMRDSTTVLPVRQTEDPGYAAGWWVNRLPDGSFVDPTLPGDAFWMQGHDGQRVYVLPSADLVVVRMGFSPSVEKKDLRVSALVADLVAACTNLC